MPAAAAALPSITDWGMSLGPLKAPQDKMPSRKVVVGSKQLASTKLLGLSGISSLSARATTSGGITMPTERTTTSKISSATSPASVT